MKTWIVTLKHDNGTVRIAYPARTAAEAVKWVCVSEGAPSRAVLSVKKSV